MSHRTTDEDRTGVRSRDLSNSKGSTVDRFQPSGQGRNRQRTERLDGLLRQFAGSKAVSAASNRTKTRLDFLRRFPSTDYPRLTLVFGCVLWARYRGHRKSGW